jgi:hypothetical protein
MAVARRRPATALSLLEAVQCHTVITAGVLPRNVPGVSVWSRETAHDTCRKTRMMPKSSATLLELAMVPELLFAMMNALALCGLSSLLLEEFM